MNEQSKRKQEHQEGVWTTDLVALRVARQCWHWSTRPGLLPLMVDVTGLSLALCSLDLLRTGLRNTNIYMLSVRNIQLPHQGLSTGNNCCMDNRAR